LLLLTKIERQQFSKSEWIDLAPLVHKKLAQLQPFLTEKHISLSTEIESLSLRIHPVLADVLLNNLLGNAIRHNLPTGKLMVVLNSHVLTISNTGHPLDLFPDLLFERFRKQSTNSESLGLGLAIVKEICDQYGYVITYNYAGGSHEVRLDFTPIATGEQRLNL
jgi:signal transduction histidine kinase